MSDPLNPLDPQQTETAEQQAAREGYLHRLLVGLDQFVNVVADGSPDETISSRWARGSEAGKPLDEVLSQALDLFQNNHGPQAQAGDMERALAVIAAEQATGFIHPLARRPVKLGRRSARRNGASRAKMAKLSAHLDALPPAPTALDYTYGITDWGMMDNDSLGDCTIAGPGHIIQSWTAGSSTEATVPDSVVLAAYEQWDGYVAGDPSTDQGGDILTVCQDWEKNGLGGHPVTAYAEVDMTQERVMQALYLFGALNCGVQLPLSAQAQVGSLWTFTGDGQTGDNEPGSWGGHCTAVVAADADGVTCVTWGQLQKMTWQFFMLYYDETVALISPEFKAPVDLATLTADLQAVGS